MKVASFKFTLEMFQILGALSLAIGIFIIIDKDDERLQILSRIPGGSEAIDTAVGQPTIFLFPPLPVSHKYSFLPSF